MDIWQNNVDNCHKLKISKIISKFQWPPFDLY